MKRIIIIFLIILVILTGCKNKDESKKNHYLKFKSTLLETTKYTSNNDLPCEITIKVNRISNEKISYIFSLSKPKENMNNIRAIVVHNYYTEDIFPSVGLFNKRPSLKISNENNKEIKLSGKIESTDDIDELNLELKALIEYETDNHKIKDIYYKST